MRTYVRSTVAVSWVELSRGHPHLADSWVKAKLGWVPMSRTNKQSGGHCAGTPKSIKNSEEYIWIHSYIQLYQSLFSLPCIGSFHHKWWLCLTHRGLIWIRKFDMSPWWVSPIWQWQCQGLTKTSTHSNTNWPWSGPSQLLWTLYFFGSGNLSFHTIARGKVQCKGKT